MNGADFGIECTIRSKEPLFKDILTCLLESLFFLKSSGGAEIGEKLFYDSFTYPIINNDPKLDEYINSIITSKELSFETDKIGDKNDTLILFVKFSNSTFFERWNIVFKVKNNVSEKNVTDSIKKALDKISSEILSSNYKSLNELGDFKVGMSLKYYVDVDQKNFPQNSLSTFSSFFNNPLKNIFDAVK